MPIILVMVAFATPVAANELYVAHIVTSGTSPDRRPAALALCLDQVLVKLSGDASIIGDSATDMLRQHAAEMIGSFEYRDRMTGIPMHDEQGSYDRPHDLTCIFNQAKLDDAVRKLKRRPWPGPRQTVALSVVVTGPDGKQSVLTADAETPRGRDMASVIRAVADTAGVPVEVTVKAPPGTVPLIGRLDWNMQGVGWKAEWSMASGDKTVRWAIRNVSFDDAFRDAVAGAAHILSGNGLPANASSTP